MSRVFLRFSIASVHASFHQGAGEGEGLWWEDKCSRGIAPGLVSVIDSLRAVTIESYLVAGSSVSSVSKLCSRCSFIVRVGVRVFQSILEWLILCLKIFLCVVAPLIVVMTGKWSLPSESGYTSHVQ